MVYISQGPHDPIQQWFDHWIENELPRAALEATFAAALEHGFRKKAATQVFESLLMQYQKAFWAHQAADFVDVFNHLVDAAKNRFN